MKIGIIIYCADDRENVVQCIKSVKRNYSGEYFIYVILPEYTLNLHREVNLLASEDANIIISPYAYSDFKAGQVEILGDILKETKSDAVIFFTANDVIAPSSIEALSKTMEENKAVFVYGNVVQKVKDAYKKKADFIEGTDETILLSQTDIACHCVYYTSILYGLFKTSALRTALSQKAEASVYDIIVGLSQQGKVLKVNNVVAYSTQSVLSIFDEEIDRAISLLTKVFQILLQENKKDACYRLFEYSARIIFLKFRNIPYSESVNALNEQFKDLLKLFTTKADRLYIEQRLKINLEMYLDLPYEYYLKYNQSVQDNIKTLTNVPVVEKKVSSAPVVKIAEAPLTYDSVTQAYYNGKLGMRAILKSFRNYVSYKLRPKKG